MSLILKNTKFYKEKKLIVADITIDNSGAISEIKNIKNDCTDFDYILIPSLVDVHVHLREPGFFYKETIKTGTLAASRGGYGAVCAMPNLKPVPDCLENLKKELEIIEKDALIKVIPYGSITKGEEGKTLSNFYELSKYVCAFSDDGRGVQNNDIMEEAMLEAKKLNKIIVAHCEDNSLLNGGYINNGIYAKKHNHKGINSESEYIQIARDIELVKKTKCKYHVCHISTKESVELIRKAKKENLDITCETAPHYLIFSDEDLQESGNFKMNPPIRSEKDRLALIEGLKDGTIDMIATDHAPHSEEEKSKGLKDSLNGIVGLETAFPSLYTFLVKKNIITLEKLIELMSTNPKKRFNIEIKNSYVVFDVKNEYEIKKEDFLSKGKSSPFIGKKVYGKCILNVYDGEIIYQN